MFRNGLIGLAALGLIATHSAAEAQRSNGGFERLGTLRADYERDRDDLEIRDPRKRFWGLRFSAENGEVRIREVEVHFLNGDSKKYTVGRKLDPKASDIYLDLESDEGRRIREVVVIHRSVSGTRQPRARISIDGDLATPPPPASSIPQRGYERVAIQRVPPGSQSITFDIGRDEGRLAKLRFRPIGGRLEISRTEVEYGNRDTDRDRFRQNLRDGEVSDELDLEGRRRFVRNVRLDLANHSVGRGARWVEVYATQRARGGRGGGRPSGGIDIPSGYEELATLRVAGGRQEGRFDIPRRTGPIASIGLIADDTSVSIGEVTVRLDRGSTQRFKVERRLRPRDGMLKLQMNRPVRADSIEIDYRGLRREGRRDAGRLALLVEPAERDRGDRRPDRGRGDWQLLGSQRAALLSKDSDYIEVGRDAGRFRALRVGVKRQDIRIYRMTITYENGETERVPISGWVREGTVSDPFDLKGNRRNIRRIHLQYRSKLGLQGSGIIEVYGLR